MYKKLLSYTADNSFFLNLFKQLHYRAYNKLGVLARRYLSPGSFLLAIPLADKFQARPYNMVWCRRMKPALPRLLLLTSCDNNQNKPRPPSEAWPHGPDSYGNRDKKDFCFHCYEPDWGFYPSFMLLCLSW
jgi:hypothetical protein